MARTPVEAIIANTRMEETYYDDGTTVRRFYIFPVEGYALHNNAYDEEVVDPETLEPTGKIRQRFTTAFTTVVGTYNFELNPNNIFAVPLSELKENQLCGGNNNNHKTE